jgi:hypothetical protein
MLQMVLRAPIVAEQESDFGGTPAQSPKIRSEIAENKIKFERKARSQTASL